MLYIYVFYITFTYWSQPCQPAFICICKVLCFYLLWILDSSVLCNRFCNLLTKGWYPCLCLWSILTADRCVLRRRRGDSLCTVDIAGLVAAITQQLADINFHHIFSWSQSFWVDLRKKGWMAAVSTRHNSIISCVSSHGIATECFMIHIISPIPALYFAKTFLISCAPTL